MHQDIHTSAWFLTIATRVCFGLWLDLLSVLFIAIVIYSFVIAHHCKCIAIKNPRLLVDISVGAVNGSLVGLALSQSLILTGMLQFGMRQTAEVVNQLTSVERVMQYTHLESENTVATKTLTYPWPTQGSIQFRNLSLRYSEYDPPVLYNLNITVTSGSKIGIVGRTGAGKSSLIAALFRMALIDGQILIDNIDTKDIPLDRLRKKISIIPQEPVLFSATLRYNLDPFQEFDDDRLWNVLEEVEINSVLKFQLQFDIIFR
jgi:ATP-binding cassette subfamily C (CFTR/MRP) protein 4